MAVLGIALPFPAAIIVVIANAICNAIGARIHRLPMTPDKILEALRNKAK